MRQVAGTRNSIVKCRSHDGFHSIAYQDSGAPDNPDVLLCLHGITGVSGDFDFLITQIRNRFRVICPDLAGHGRSDKLRNAHNYQLFQYVSDIVSLLDAIQVPKVTLLGTAMGGLIGIRFASMFENRVEKLILNDSSPSLDTASQSGIYQYMNQPRRFNTFDEGLQFIRRISGGAGKFSAPQLQKSGVNVLKLDVDGMWVRHFDSKLVIPLLAESPELQRAAQAILWDEYDSLSCPTLLLRGANSGLLTRHTAWDMTRRGPKARFVEFENTGHAPALNNLTQTRAIVDFLLDVQPAMNYFGPLADSASLHVTPHEIECQNLRAAA